MDFVSLETVVLLYMPLKITNTVADILLSAPRRLKNLAQHQEYLTCSSGFVSSYTGLITGSNNVFSFRGYFELCITEGIADIGEHY